MTTSLSQEESRLSDRHGTTSEMSFRDGEYDNKPVTGRVKTQSEESGVGGGGFIEAWTVQLLSRNLKMNIMGHMDPPQRHIFSESVTPPSQALQLFVYTMYTITN